MKSCASSATSSARIQPSCPGVQTKVSRVRERQSTNYIHSYHGDYRGDASSFVEQFNAAATKVSTQFAISQNISIHVINSPVVIYDETPSPVSRKRFSIGQRWKHLQRRFMRSPVQMRAPLLATSLTWWQSTYKAMVLSIIKLTVSRPEV